MFITKPVIYFKERNCNKFASLMVLSGMITQEIYVSFATIKVANFVKNYL
ncbi:hypothetical protein [Campylobacter troglodytis]|nr:hypothetical protein [Campylobacter troglodytis]